MKITGWVILACLLLVNGTMKARHLPQWLERAVVYQIYPASFKDSDGDGIGDLKGIESQLDYIKSIGVNTIWISPVFSSEFFDGGYDVTDFYSVDKRYGTNTELVRLVNKVHEKGMRIFMDLVAGHTSDKHPWFIQSKQADTNLQYSDYYIWTNGKDQKPKKYVDSDAERDGYYMKNFFDCQPALNYGFANPNPNHPWEQPVDAPGPQAVRRELKNIISFWMDKGMDGFRVDMAYSLIKNDSEHVETSRLWKEISAWFTEKYPEGAFIAEWGEPTNSIGGGFHIDFLFHIGRKGYTSLFFNKKKTEDINCYFGLEGAGSLKQFVEMYKKEYEATKGKGYISLPTSNHDIWRLACGKRTEVDQLKVAMTFLLTMPGVPCIYYGDEIGMRYIEGLPDVEGSVLASRNRAGSRTPMQWDASANWGFSTALAEKLYIPVDSDKNAPYVEKEQADESSLLNYVRCVLKLRASSKALGNIGEWTFVSDVKQPYPMVYLREADGERYCVVVNPSAKKVATKFATLGSEKKEIVIGDKKQVKYKSGLIEDRVEIDPVSAVIFKFKK
ncbi:alpha-amylase family glycosyl hydrolase [Bacteroides ovatus]|uniref:alpha-amylase family glycosyl hydrolase n=2 Tax=Bacteroides TaxID=816 RepID=UPI003D648204